MGPDESKTASEWPQITPEQLEASKIAFGGLVANLGSHDPYRDPDADADAAQRTDFE